MPQTLIIIQQGAAITAESPITFLGTGSAGDPDACRRLVFPLSVAPTLAPIVYAVGTAVGEGPLCINPQRTLNLDNVVLTHPTTNVVKTIGDTKVVRFENAVSDTIVTEIWEAPGGASMPTSFLRLLFEYLDNAKLIDAQAGPFIQWEPRDRSTVVYNVELLSLDVGGGNAESRFDIQDVRAVSGDFDTGVDNVGGGVNTGMVTETVTLRMRIISVAV